jgi:transposase-like protein
MSTGKPRDLHKEQEWRRRLRDWERSGLSVSAFSRRYGVAENRLYAWRRILAQRDAEQAAFVPVRLLADNGSQDDTLEVVLAGGRRLRVPKGFDAATLRQLLAVLEEQTPC